MDFDFTQYIELLNKILSYGPKVAPVMEEVAGFVEDFLTRMENIRVILGMEKGPMRLVAPSSDVLALESRVIEAVQGPNMTGRIQEILDFIRSNQDLVKLLLLLL